MSPIRRCGGLKTAVNSKRKENVQTMNSSASFETPFNVESSYDNVTKFRILYTFDAEFRQGKP